MEDKSLERASEADEDYEPQVTSSDPNERKLARQLRIERRWNAIRRTAMIQENIYVEETVVKSPVQIQTEKSIELLDKYIKESDEYITNIRVANDSREVDRRELEGVGREKIIEQLGNEAEAANEMFHEIAAKWSIIQDYKDPLHIHEDIANQKEKCDLLIKQKDEIIAMLRDEIKQAERKFTRDQQKQMDDINILSQRIEKQCTFMRNAYQTEFEIIEEVMLSQRQNTIDQNNKKWDDLYQKREQQEHINTQNKFERLEEFNKKMTKIRVDFQEKYRDIKIKLERDIEFMQRELERIKALTLMNREKLDYNYQILRKREDENLIIKSQQKRRMNKLQDIINNEKQKLLDFKNTSNNRIKKLSSDIKKLHRNIMDIEAKADRFATINDEKFHKIWDVNKVTVEKVLNRIVETDQLLHEQQMGIPWEAPTNTVAKKNHLPSYRNALAQLADQNIASVPSYESTLSKGSFVSNKTPKDKKAENSALSLFVSDFPSPEECDNNSNYRRLVKHVLTRISDKSGFLTDKQLKKVLLENYEDSQKTLVKLYNVFESLQIRDKKLIDILVDYFVPFAYCVVCAGTDMDGNTMSRFTSQVSHMSAIFPQWEQDDDVDIVELDRAYYAIQQPDQVIDEIIVDLVASNTSFEEKDDAERNIIDDICGEAMLDHVYTDVAEKMDIKKKTKTTDKMMCRFSHPLVISSIYILIALREFVSDYYKAGKELPTTRQRLKRKRLTISRLLSDDDIVAFWDSYKKVYDAKRIRIWDALLEGLKHYHEILKDRKNLCEEVLSLRKQNEDLKRLLANYLDHKQFMPAPCTNQDICLSTTVPPYTKSK